MFKSILKNVEKNTPLVHCITNYVTVNDVANILLASGCSPVMADDESEVEDITSISTSLCINIGTLNKRTISSMIKAGKMANELSRPVVLDPVGAGASKLRTETSLKLLDEVKFSVIRGNISEIKTLSQGYGDTQGVDASVQDAITDKSLKDTISFAKDLSSHLNTIIAITGVYDIVTDGNKAYILKNGHPDMSKITGTGCMLSALIAGFIGANPNEKLNATAVAVAMMGLCGELAHKKMRETDTGTGSLRTYIIDYISKIDYKSLERGVKIETR